MYHKNVIFTDTAIRTSTHLTSRKQVFFNANSSWQWNETGPLASALIYIGVFNDAVSSFEYTHL
jgi:hypothetical protein